MITAHWYCLQFLLIIIIAVFKDTICTVWDGITPWYTGSKCNCNGHSNRCYFDQKLYEKTGHGGHCLDCLANRDGPNCELCRENYHMREDGYYCIACNCNEIGSRSLQCNTEGKCQCKSGIVGEKCDRCDINHFDFTTYGCKSCECSELGSANNQRNCDPYSGACYCKENVEGKRCRECKPGFFNLDIDNILGCTPCFCYGHSSQCQSALGFSKYLLESTFAKSSEKWRAEDEYGRPIDLKYDAFSHSIGVHAISEKTIYFVVPDRFLADQRASYNQLMEFTLRIGDNRPTPTATDIILQGGGATVTNTIFAQQNRIPTIQNQKYSFRLHEHPEYEWQPRLSSKAFISMLTNLTAIKIKGTYAPQGVGYIDDVKLETAARGVAGQPALWMESCDCPTGYVGQFCESCAPGFRHSPALGGPFMPCVPCYCNNHASICDSETGRCICQHNTTGDNCELCARGYYGNALGGTSKDCLSCSCPNGGACSQIDEDIIICTECPLGYTGHRCDSCSDGFYGDPNGQFGLSTPCQPCECSMNIDLNAIGNCNTTTGECLKCIHNTGGQKCDICLPGYFGNALVLPKGDCKQCQCHPPGTEEDLLGAPTCDQTIGSCHCKPHVVSLNCDKCEKGYYNLHSGQGCQTCNCDPIGSLNYTCDIYTGQCYCRPGVTGPRCDHCEARKYGFSSEGCKNCECDIIGSRDLQCDASGQCSCLDNVEGRKCNRCKENKYDRQIGCINCSDCYNLVQNAARSHNNKLNRLNDILDETERQPTVIAHEDFPKELRELEKDIDEFHEKVKNITGERSIIQQVQNISDRGKEISRTLSEVDENMFLINDKNFKAEKDIFNADLILEEATEKLSDIIATFENKGEKKLEDAWKRAKIVGQQSDKMTEIAQETRDMADTLDTKAGEITHTVKEAKNKSIEAYDKVKNTNSQQAEINEALRFIKQDILNMEAKLNKSKEWTKVVSDKAVIVKNNALALLNEVKNLVVSLIDIPELKKKSKDLEEEVFKLKKVTSDLFRNSDELRKNIEEKKYFGKELLQKAHNQQEEINDLRNDLVFYESQVDRTINLWNEILERADSNYKLLAEFDTKTQQSKKEAETALQTIGEMEAILTDTIDKTNNAQNKLEDAKKNANLALEKAMQADILAKNASSNAERIKKEAEELHKNTTALSGEAELMFDRVQNTEGEYKNLFEKTKSNNTLVNEAKKKVGRAGKDTNEASKRVLNLLGDVEGIVAELQNSPNINDKDIDRLEEELKITEERLKEAKLDEKLENLKQEHKLQDDLIDKYKKQIIFLQKEVENIEQIVNTLPDGCFKRVELEP